MEQRHAGSCGWRLTADHCYRAIAWRGHRRTLKLEQQKNLEGADPEYHTGGIGVMRLPRSIIYRRLIPREDHVWGIPAGWWLALNILVCIVLWSPLFFWERLFPTDVGGSIDSIYVIRDSGMERVMNSRASPGDREVIGEVTITSVRYSKGPVIPYRYQYLYLIRGQQTSSRTCVPPSRIADWIPEINHVWGLNIGPFAERESDRVGFPCFQDLGHAEEISWLGFAWNLLALSFALVLPIRTLWWVRCMRDRSGL